MPTAALAADPHAPSPEAEEAAGLVHGPATAVDRLIDRLNPIFVKETRQAVKSRQFVGAFLTLLFVSWLISLVVVTSAGQQLDFGSWGRDLFASYFVVLAGAIVVVVPFTAFRSLMSEREEATFEPLIISTLTPRQIVFGKLYSAMLQAFLFYSAIAPFMAFTALLQGFDIAYVAVLLAMGLGVSLWVSIAALAISAIVKGRMWQTIVSLAVLFGLLIVFGITWGMAFETWWMRWDDPWTIAGLLAWTAAGVANIVLLQEVAVANLTFASDNRSTGLRLIAQGQILLIWVGVLVAIWWFGGFSGSDAQELCIVGATLSLLLWTGLGLFFVTESEGLSQRIVRRMPRRAAVRVLAAPLYPGGSRGLLLVSINLLALAGVWFALQVFYPGENVEALSILAACILYLWIYLHVGAAVARWGMRLWPSLLPLHCRIGTLVLIGLSMAAPMVLLLFDSYDPYRSRQYSLLSISNPFVTLEQLDRNHADAAVVTMLLFAGAIVSTVVNLRSMARGLYEIVAARPLPPQPSQS
jgi:hypothetical protein